MDKQKSYGENYEQCKVKHRFSVRFALGTLFACVVTVVIVAVCLGVKF